MMALRGFRAAGGVIGGLSITLEKNIPVGAGLGGGSADAAALLRAVNALSTAPLDDDALYRLAASLGADVPVCLAGGCQRIAGIGESMTPINLDFMGSILLVNPRIPLSTKDVFTRFTGPKSGFASSLSNLDAASMVGLGNDLTAIAIELAPAINNCLNHLAGSKGAIATAMSGSGASCFALFDHIDNAEIAAAKFENAGYWARSSMIYQPD
jgi:4-diphosphocytidyl-2-C-methyl-D-erythritol kinase